MFELHEEQINVILGDRRKYRSSLIQSWNVLSASSELRRKVKAENDDKRITDV